MTIKVKAINNKVYIGSVHEKVNEAGEITD